MISKKAVLILSLCVAGSIVPAYGTPCAASGTLNTYVGTTCSIGAYTFTFQSWTPAGSGSPNATPAGGIPDTSVTLTTIGNANGTGFKLTPIGPWSAQNGGFTDGELKYYITGSGITKLYQEIDGTVAPHGIDDITDTFCLGSTDTTMSGPCNNLDGSPGGSAQQIHSDIITNGDSGLVSGITFTDHGNGVDNDGCAGGSAYSPDDGECHTSALFSAVNSIAVKKDIRGDTSAGGTNAAANITAVYNQFGPAVVPEPGTVLLSFIGLGLLFLGRHRFSRS